MMHRSLPALLLCIVVLCLAAPLVNAAEEAPSSVSAAEAENAPVSDEAEPAAQAEPGTGDEEAVGAEAVEPAPVEAAPAAAETAEPAPLGESEPPEEETAEVEPPPVLAPIISIEVTGNAEISTEEILAAVSSAVEGPYSEEQVARDRQAVLNLGWFQTVAVDRESVENGVRLTFRVTENPVIRDVQFEGIKELKREDLLAVMKTQPGTVYNTYRLAEDAQAIEELYRSEGYILAIVLGAQRMTEEGVLPLVVAEGVIEAIRLTGNTRTKDYVIRRYVRTKPGDTYNAKAVGRDIGRLTGTGYFDTVRQEAEVGETPGKVILVITVVEKQRTGQAVIGGAYTSVQGIIGFVDLTKTNLRGTGQTVSLRGEWGGRRSYEIGYRNPWVMTPETRLNLGIYDRYILREAYVTTPEGVQQDILYDERRAGENLTLGRPVSDRTTVYVGLRRDDVSISGLSPEEEPYLSGPAFAPREVRSLTLATVTDTRDNVHSPRRGAYHQISAEFAGIFGGSEFNKYSTDNRRYFRVGGRNVLAMRLLAGMTSGDAPYLEQFLIGGPDSLRGYRVDRLAGSRMAILNTEFRFPLSSNLVGVTFVDVGDAWGGAIASDPFLRGGESFTAHVGYGVGVRVQTPIGPIRLDLGFSEDGAETHFGISQMF